MPVYSGHVATLWPDQPPGSQGEHPVPPAAPSSFSAGQTHHARQMAESFGTDPERYDRARPRYPREMIDAIVAASPGRSVLDVCCGTGISARAFQAAGCRVLGVDVDTRMAEFARRQGLEVEEARFEEWDPAGRTFDIVASGQSWHWVDPLAGAVKAAAALHPGGRLAVFWNVVQPPPDLSDAFTAVYRRVLPDSPFSRGLGRGVEAYSGLHAKAADGMLQVGAFVEPEQWRFDWERTYTRDEWLDQVPTSGGHRQFPPAALEALLEGMGEAIDAVGGSFTMGYAAVVVTAARSGT